MDTVTAVKQEIQENARSLGRWMGLRGLITLALGLLFLARPGVGVAFLLVVFAVYCFVDGLVLLTAAFGGSLVRSRGWLAFEGIVSIAAGVITLMLPGNAAIALLFIIAVRALIMGLLEALGAIRLGHAIPNPWLLALTGVLSIVFGILLLRNPQAGLLSVAWLVGLYGVIVGLSEMMAAFGMRRAVKQVTTPLTPTPTGR